MNFKVISSTIEMMMTVQPKAGFSLYVIVIVERDGTGVF